MIIESGEGNRYKAEVKSNNKLATEAVVASRAAYQADVEGQSYLFSTGGFISITTVDTETGIFYIKYNGEGHLHLTSIRTCGTASNLWKFYKNPTGGTLISAATAAESNNTKFDSSNTVDVNCYKGANGSTLTGGTVIENWINAMGHSTEEFDGVLILGKNDSLALTCQVPSSASVCVRILGFVDAGVVL